MTKKVHLQCGAKTRKGTACKCKKLPGKNRCKFHGGMSTGPRTEEGKKRAAENLVKARAVLAAKSPEWFHARAKKAGETRSRRIALQRLYDRLGVS